MKKAWGIILILALAVLLSGCGKNGEDLEEAVTGVFDQIEEGFDDVEDRLDQLEDSLNGTADDEPEPTEAAEEPAQEQPEEAAEAEPAEAAVPDGDIRPEIKQAIDDYEAFFNEYAEFMESYSASDNSAGMLADYMSMMARYAETMESFDAMEDMEMNDAELKYYADASLRISQLLLSAAG